MFSLSLLLANLLLSKVFVRTRITSFNTYPHKKNGTPFKFLHSMKKSRTSISSKDFYRYLHIFYRYLYTKYSLRFDDLEKSQVYTYFTNFIHDYNLNNDINYRSDLDLYIRTSYRYKFINNCNDLELYRLESKLSDLRAKCASNSNNKSIFNINKASENITDADKILAKEKEVYNLKVSRKAYRKQIEQVYEELVPKPDIGFAAKQQKKKKFSNNHKDDDVIVDDIFCDKDEKNINKTRKFIDKKLEIQLQKQNKFAEYQKRERERNIKFAKEVLNIDIDNNK